MKAVGAAFNQCAKSISKEGGMASSLRAAPWYIFFRRKEDMSINAMRAGLKVYASTLPHCVVIIDQRSAFWYVVDKRSHAILDYGSQHGRHACATFLEYLPGAR